MRVIKKPPLLKSKKSLVFKGRVLRAHKKSSNIDGSSGGGIKSFFKNILKKIFG